MLQNAAKHGKLMENYEHFWGAGLGAGREVFSQEGMQKDFFGCEECCKNQMMAG
jgi:hypothetical protein